jgi:hypothetical protein
MTVVAALSKLQQESVNDLLLKVSSSGSATQRIAWDDVLALISDREGGAQRLILGDDSSRTIKDLRL